MGRDKYALADDGTVWAWGRNAMGELGDGTTVTRTALVWVVDPDELTSAPG